MTDLYTHYLSLKDNTMLVKLDKLGALRVKGEEAKTFLQNIVSSDLSKLNTDSSMLSSLCNIKGRMISLFRLYKHEGSYTLILPRDLIDKTQKMLTRYIFRAKVSITVVDNIKCLAVCGLAPNTALENALGTVPEKINGKCQHNGLTLIKLFDQPLTYLLIAEDKALANITVALNKVCQPADTALWDLLHIEHYQPIVTHTTSETLLPQEIELEKLGGLSYQKGCFVGQEVIARLHYKGKLKHTLRHVEIQCDDVLTPLLTLIDENKNTLGTLIFVVKITDNSYRALMLLKDNATILLDDTSINLSAPESGLLIPIKK